MNLKIKNELGNRYGRLLVVLPATSIASKARWTCVCDCGSTKTVTGDSLRTGRVKSCGCLSVESRHLRAKHGHGSYAKGVTRTYKSWQAMRERCVRKMSISFKNYGGRGVSVCSRWDSFENFLADMGERPVGTSLDRIDNDGNYEPENCRWATRIEQNNKRRQNVNITHNGITKTIAQWCSELGLNYSRTYRRLVIQKLSPAQAFDSASLRPRKP